VKVSAQLTFWIAIAFALASFAYAMFGFTSVDASMTDAERADSRGFALFWLFLAGIGAAMAIVSWLMAKGHLGGDQ
jgi:hypothetical protein